jgi:TolA-binding protein
MTREDVKEVEAKRVMQDQVTTLQRTNADQTNRFSEVDAEMRALSGRIEVLERELAQTTKERDKLSKQSEASDADTTMRLQALQETMVKLEEHLNALAAEYGQYKQAMSEKAVANSPIEKGGKTGGSKLLQEADGLFGQKEWKKAIVAYEKFREANPKSKSLGEATYKIGVCFQELGMKTEAKSFFEEVTAKYGSSEAGKKAQSRLKKLK